MDLEIVGIGEGRNLQVHLGVFDDPCQHLQVTGDAADEYDIYDDDIDFTIPEWVYELAVEVERWWLGLDDEPDMLDDDGESEEW